MHCAALYSLRAHSVWTTKYHAALQRLAFWRNWSFIASSSCTSNHSQLWLLSDISCVLSAGFYRPSATECKACRCFARPHVGMAVGQRACQLCRGRGTRASLLRGTRQSLCTGITHADPSGKGACLSLNSLRCRSASPIELDPVGFRQRVVVMEGLKVSQYPPAALARDAHIGALIET